MKVAVLLLTISILAILANAETTWQAGLDSKVRFYQMTDLGVILAGTEKSLYAIDAQTGAINWREGTGGINETAVTPVPETDIVLFSRDLGDKSRLEAVDLLSGDRIWQSDKVKGDVMQLAVDPQNDLLAVVLVKDARGKLGDKLERKPVIHMLKLSNGDELWKQDLGLIEMMPSRFGESGEIGFTLDNYRAPLLLDGRLFLFYEGSTSFDAASGSEREREKFKINEDGLALTEADPVIDAEHVFVSGRGKVRAVNRQTGQVDWKADDLGTCSEMAIVGTTLFVRTGGQFTRLEDGETEEKGPFGVSAIDTRSGKTLWRYKGADKGMTNFAFADMQTIVLADKDALVTLDASDGKVRSKTQHKIEKAQFVLVNERRQAVVGGRDEIAGFTPGENKARELWHVAHKPPSRGVLRIVAGVALRAAAIYFRYGGVATSALNLVRGGIGLASAVNSFRLSGLQTRFGSINLSTLASNAATSAVSRRLYAFGSIARVPGVLDRVQGLQIQRPSLNVIGRTTPSRSDIKGNILDRIDPIRQAERLSSYLLRRQRLAELRGNFMYYYTDLPKPMNGKGLAGVNVTSGQDARYFGVSDPDANFVVDEPTGLLFSADGNRLQAFSAR